MEKKLTRRESRETAFLTAFAATFEPEEPTVPAEEHAAPDAFANQLLAAMNDHAAELDEIITAHLKGWTLSRVPPREPGCPAPGPGRDAVRRRAEARRRHQRGCRAGQEIRCRGRLPVRQRACWVPLRVSAARPPNLNADAGHRHQQLRNLSGSV